MAREAVYSLTAPAALADGEEVEAAPVDAEDFVMEAADEAAFDEEEWV